MMFCRITKHKHSVEERKSGLPSLTLNTMTIKQIAIKIDGIIKVKLSYNNNTLFI